MNTGVSTENLPIGVLKKRKSSEWGHSQGEDWLYNISIQTNLASSGARFFISKIY